MKIIDYYFNRKRNEIYLIRLKPYLNRKFTCGFAPIIKKYLRLWERHFTKGLWGQLKLNVFLNELKTAYFYNYFHIHTIISHKVKDTETSYLFEKYLVPASTQIVCFESLIIWFMYFNLEFQFLRNAYIFH